MLVGLTLLFLVIFYVLGASIARFSAGIGSYSAELNERLASIQASVTTWGSRKSTFVRWCSRVHLPGLSGSSCPASQASSATFS